MKSGLPYQEFQQRNYPQQAKILTYQSPWFSWSCTTLQQPRGFDDKLINEKEPTETLDCNTNSSTQNWAKKWQQNKAQWNWLEAPTTIHLNLFQNPRGDQLNSSTTRNWPEAIHLWDQTKQSTAFNVCKWICARKRNRLFIAKWYLQPQDSKYELEIQLQLWWWNVRGPIVTSL